MTTATITAAQGEAVRALAAKLRYTDAQFATKPFGFQARTMRTLVAAGLVERSASNFTDYGLTGYRLTEDGERWLREHGCPEGRGS